MSPEKIVQEIMDRLSKIYPAPRCALNYSNPLELLIATILSAQCTDERVNKVTPALFKRFPTAKAFVEAPIEEVEEMIRSTGFFRNKAKNIKECCKKIIENFNGKIPQTMEDLTSLPGVARKTANVVLGNAFGKNEGIVVDTHVKRLAFRLGFTKEQKNTDKIEKDLMKIVPREQWTYFAHWLILHGRNVCKARNPDCKKCTLSDICPREGLK